MIPLVHHFPFKKLVWGMLFVVIALGVYGLLNGHLRWLLLFPGVLGALLVQSAVTGLGRIPPTITDCYIILLADAP